MFLLVKIGNSACP